MCSDSLSRMTTSSDVVQFELTGNTKIRLATYNPDDGVPYLAANMMVDGSWLGMKRLLTW